MKKGANTLTKKEIDLVGYALYHCLIGCGGEVDFDKKEEKVVKRLLKRLDN